MLHVLGACSAVPFAGLIHSCHFGSRSFTFHPNFNPIIVPPAVTEQGVPSGEWVREEQALDSVSPVLPAHGGLVALVCLQG